MIRIVVATVGGWLGAFYSMKPAPTAESTLTSEPSPSSTLEPTLEESSTSSPTVAPTHKEEITPTLTPMPTTNYCPKPNCNTYANSYHYTKLRCGGH